MQFHHRRLGLALDHQRHDVERTVERLVDRLLVLAVRRCSTKSPTSWLRASVTRMADADAQPPEVRRGQARWTSLRPLCPAVPPPRFILPTPGSEVELVVHDQDLVRERSCSTAPSATTAWPERFMKVVGLSSQTRGCGRACRATSPWKLALVREARPALVGHGVDQPEAGVVAGALIFGVRGCRGRRSDGWTLLSLTWNAMKKPAVSRTREAGICANTYRTNDGLLLLVVLFFSSFHPGAAGCPAAAMRHLLLSRGLRQRAGGGFDYLFDLARRDRPTPPGSSLPLSTGSRPRAESGWTGAAFWDFRPDRSTSMNSGRSFGRQLMSARSARG